MGSVPPSNQRGTPMSCMQWKEEGGAKKFEKSLRVELRS